MNKIPVPVAVGLAVIAVSALAFVIYSTFGRPGGDSGNVQAINKEIQRQIPADVPELPPDRTPAAHAVQMSKRGGVK